MKVGVSLQRFLGREPQESTTYIYSEDGRLERTITTKEAEWSPWDRALVAAFGEWERSRCSGCGLPAHEVWAGEGESVELKSRGYEAGFEVCAGCLRLEKERAVQAKLDEKVKDAVTGHRHWLVWGKKEE